MPQDEQHSQGNLEDSSDKLLLRACQACRIQKIRCVRDTPTSSSSAKCQRCKVTNRECISSEPSKRKRRKRTDTRVTELEKGLKAISSVLKRADHDSLQMSTQMGINQSDTSEATSESSFPFWKMEPCQIALCREPALVPETNTTSPSTDGTLRMEPEMTQGMATSAHFPAPELALDMSSSIVYANDTFSEYIDNRVDTSHHLIQSLDVIERGILSIQEASQLFFRYVDELVPQFPAVILPKDDSAANLRKTRPALFLAIMAAASLGCSRPELSQKLNEEALRLYANRVVIGGEKSLELVQAMLITTIWDWPPDRFEEVKFNQQIHMVASMALDIGIGKQPRNQLDSSYTSHDRSSYGSKVLTSNISKSDISFVSDSVECRRTLLACYLQCSVVSTVLRRTNMLRFSSWMGDCLICLETSPDAAKTDPRLVAWVRLQRSMEECGSSLSFDDSSATVGLAEPRVQLMLKGFVKQLDAWRRNIPLGVMNEYLCIFFYTNKTYLYEISLHRDHDMEDFRPPFLIKNFIRPNKNNPIDPAHIDAAASCIASTHSLLNTFLQTEPKVLCAVPTVNFIRMAYGVVVLVKLSFSISSPVTELGKFLEHGCLQVANYLDRLVVHLTAAAGPEKTRVASMFLSMLVQLRTWYHRQRASLDLGTQSEEQIEPLKLELVESRPEATSESNLPPQYQPEQVFGTMNINSAGVVDSYPMDTDSNLFDPPDTFAFLPADFNNWLSNDPLY